MALQIEGTNKTFGVHAAVVISSEPLDEIAKRITMVSVLSISWRPGSTGFAENGLLGLRNLL